MLSSRVANATIKTFSLLTQTKIDLAKQGMKEQDCRCTDERHIWTSETTRTGNGQRKGTVSSSYDV